MASRSQIIATIGPASGDADTLSRMLDAGVDVVRINCAHGTHESNAAYVQTARSLAQAKGKPLPVIMDLAGPRAATPIGHAFSAVSAEITEKDLADLDFALSLSAEYIGQSYVGSAEDVERLRAELRARGSSTPIIAKIERKEAVEDFSRILGAADAIMVARGDLGLAIPVEDIPFVERDLVSRAKAAGTSVIVATQMLYTMTENLIPTRAEVTDVAYAIVGGADAVMLSEESATGKHPVEAVAMMEKIVSRAEKALLTDVVHPL